MTVCLPLEASSPPQNYPSFLTASPDPPGHVNKVIKAILKAKRIAVVCGAGISVQAGIPDFRSPQGLFQTLKRDNPTLSSGKDLFDASVFNSESTTSVFCQMIAQLSELSTAATPTAFHQLLRTLDDSGKLLRVYTQNIDALESKTGLTFGVPLDQGKRKPRSTKGKPAASMDGPSCSASTSTGLNSANMNMDANPGRLPSPPAETPRCIPLHGTLQAMHCQVCTHSFPLQDHLECLSSGRPPICPECTSMEETRQLVGKRARGVGKLRPSVVLYNEVHKDGEEVGEAVRRDLVGKGRAGADLLLVVGTSLRVPGTKRIVREFSKAVRSRGVGMGAACTAQWSANEAAGASSSASTSSGGLATPRRTPSGMSVDEDAPIKSVYVNLDFPVPTREWEGVFDVWVRGDAQGFAEMVQEEVGRAAKAKEAAEERRKKREQAQALAAAEQQEGKGKGKGKEGAVQREQGKGKGGGGGGGTGTGKKRKGREEVEVVRSNGTGLVTPPHSACAPPVGKKRKGTLHASISTNSNSNLDRAWEQEHAEKVKLTIRIPARASRTQGHLGGGREGEYTPLTPPPSKRARLVPEVVIDVSDAALASTKLKARDEEKRKARAAALTLSPPASPILDVDATSSTQQTNDSCAAVPAKGKRKQGAIGHGTRKRGNKQVDVLGQAPLPSIVPLPPSFESAPVGTSQAIEWRRLTQSDDIDTDVDIDIDVDVEQEDYRRSELQMEESAGAYVFASEGSTFRYGRCGLFETAWPESNARGEVEVGT